MWTMCVDLLRASIFASSHLFAGSLGTGIVVVSALLRLALLPLMLRNARDARVQQLKLEQVKPQLDRLVARYRDNPRRLMEERQALLRANGIRLLGPASIASILIQIPLFGALFSALRSGLGERVRFLWIGDLSRADTLLVFAVTSLAAFAASLTPGTPGSPMTGRVLTFMVAGGTLAFLWSASSAVALSVGAGSAVSVIQSWLLRRDASTPARQLSRRQPAG